MSVPVSSLRVAERFNVSPTGLNAHVPDPLTPQSDSTPLTGAPKVTAAAGGMSYALMLHPQGLKADVFITHGWAEGVFEFVDKARERQGGRRWGDPCLLSAESF